MEELFNQINLISSKLFEAEQRRLNGNLVKINTKNKLLMNTIVDGYRYEGTFYCPRNIQRTVPSTAFSYELHSSLEGEAAQFKKDNENIYLDRVWIRQVLYKLLEKTLSAQDRRDALPDCLSDSLPDMTTLIRSRPEAYTIQDNRRAIKQYNRFLEKIEYYSVTRLIY